MKMSFAIISKLLSYLLFGYGTIIVFIQVYNTIGKTLIIEFKPIYTVPIVTLIGYIYLLFGAYMIFYRKNKRKVKG